MKRQHSKEEALLLQCAKKAKDYCILDNSIRLLALRLFVRVAASGSFSEAARYYGLPTSSASRHIASLEQSLGQRLLYRHTRAVRLTEAGERYFHEVRDALARLELATEQVMGGAQHPQGVLRINAPVAFGRRHIAPHLARFGGARGFQFGGPQHRPAAFYRLRVAGLSGNTRRACVARGAQPA